MEGIILAESTGIFKIFGLGFLAGGLFSFAVNLVSDWMQERNERKSQPARKI